MAAPARTTLIEVLQQVCLSVGHPQPTNVDDPDPAVQRMRFHANQACQDLVLMHSVEGWDFLVKTGNISIVSTPPNNVEQGYDLPTDFGAMLDDTQWNTSTQLPAIGPVNAQDWQWLTVRMATITTRFLWRIRGGQLWIKSPPNTAQPFSFQYISKNWGMNQDGVTPTDYLTNQADYHLYPWQLPVLFTRAKWLEGEGYASTMAHRDFQRALQYYVGTDRGATALSLVPGVGYPYLNADRNLPNTGYGS